jgi:DNA repair photolyase
VRPNRDYRAAVISIIQPVGYCKKMRSHSQQLLPRISAKLCVCNLENIIGIIFICSCFYPMVHAMTISWTEGDDSILPDRPIKGRGSVSNRSGRFEGEQRARIDDGWLLEEDLGDRPRLRTQLGIDAARSVITRNTSPDVPFDRSINPYRGCEHGCVYCFARPTHAYLGLSPGLDFETKLFWKPDAAALLTAELARPKYRCGPIAFGTNTDPYQPVERETFAMRGLLQVLRDCSHPFSIVTKNALICRDLDLIAPAGQANQARVMLSVTTLDRGLANKMEPRASTPEKRLDAIRRLSDAGVPTGVLVAPIIPAVNDHEIEEIVTRAAEAGATSAGHVLLRLPLEIEDLFKEWLATHMPDRAERVLSLIRQSHGGQLYRSNFGERMRGSGPYADMIATRMKLARKKLGLDRRTLAMMDCTAFTPPQKPSAQLSLL